MSRDTRIVIGLKPNIEAIAQQCLKLSQENRVYNFVPSAEAGMTTAGYRASCKQIEARQRELYNAWHKDTYGGQRYETIMAARGLTAEQYAAELLQ